MMIDPNQQEALNERRNLTHFMSDTFARSSGIHMQDAQMAIQKLKNLYNVLPVRNTQPQEDGEEFEGAYLRLKDKITAVSDDKERPSDERAIEIWLLVDEFIPECTNFMYNTLFVKPGRKRKEHTQGIGYE